MAGHKGKKRAVPAEFDEQPVASGSGTSKQAPKKAKLEYSSPPVPAVKRSPTKPRRGRPRSCANATRPTITLKPSLPLVVSPEEPHFKLGTFDFYSLDHAALKDAFNVETGRYDYDMIFNILYQWQQSGVAATVRCFLPDLPSAEDEKGRMLCRALAEEDDGRVHEIVVSSLQITEPFECAGVQGFPLKKEDDEAAAVQGNCFVADVNTTNVSISGGTFRMNIAPAWSEFIEDKENMNTGIDLAEVFEGHIDMAVKYRLKGGQRLRCALVGIRSYIAMEGWERDSRFSGFYAKLDQARLPVVTIP